MGKYKIGILGPFNGKIGTVIGSSWRGIDYMRSLSRRGNRVPSAVQLLQRQRFLATTQFLTPIHPVLRKYYGGNGGGPTRINNALSYHMKEAVTYVDPDFEMLYNKVQISVGTLPQVQNPSVSSPSANTIKYGWDDNSGDGAAKATDKLVVVVYAPAANLYFYRLAAATRSDATASITIPAYFSGLEVQSWITFAADDDSSCATSSYMPAVIIT